MSLGAAQQLRCPSASGTPSLLPNLWPSPLLNTLGQHPEKRRLQLILAQAFLCSAAALGTYKEQEVEEEEEVLGDF